MKKHKQGKRRIHFVPAFFIAACIASVLIVSAISCKSSKDECAPGTFWDGAECVDSLRERQPCTGLPEGASWNTASEIDQTWDGEEWIPSATGVYNEEPSSTECRFICNENHTWDGSECLVGTRSGQECSGLPAHASWNTASEIDQTWNGEEWIPPNTGVYNEEPSSTECRFICDNGYLWDGEDCVQDPDSPHTDFEETWWLAADAHIGSHRDGELNALSNLYAAVDDINDLGISSWALMLGDFVHDSPDHLEDYEDAMNELNHPWEDVLGNHDFDRHGTGARVKERTYFSFIAGGVRFIAVSDDGSWNNGDVIEAYQTEKNLMQDQNDWFKAELDGDPGIPTVLLTHQGLWRYYENPSDDGPCFWDLNRRGWLQEDWDNYNIPLWIRGHNHAWRLNENYRGLGVVDVSPGAVANDTGGGIFLTIKRENGTTTITLRFRTHTGEWREVAGYSEYVMEIITAVHDWHDLNNVRYNLDGNFILMNDLDENTPGYDDYNSGDGWEPIGETEAPFTGSLDGRGHSIKGLRINRSTARVGLFGHVETGFISNLSLLDVDISTTGSRAGALAGEIENTYISDCRSTGKVFSSGQYNVGGLVGRAGGRSLIIRSSSSADVTHDWSDGTGSNSGGLVGRTGDHTQLIQTFANGSVNGDSNSGGLVGRSGGEDENTAVYDSYSRGEVQGSGSRIGGLAGRNYGIVFNSYATSKVSGGSDTGGLIGADESTASVQASFWDTQTSGLTESGAGQGLTTEEMKNQVVYENANWDFENTWSIEASLNDGYPHLLHCRFQ